jgi:hypothetical protein
MRTLTVSGGHMLVDRINRFFLLVQYLYLPEVALLFSLSTSYMSLSHWSNLNLLSLCFLKTALLVKGYLRCITCLDICLCRSPPLMFQTVRGAGTVYLWGALSICTLACFSVFQGSPISFLGIPLIFLIRKSSFSILHNDYWSVNLIKFFYHELKCLNDSVMLYFDYVVIRFRTIYFVSLSLSLSLFLSVCVCVCVCVCVWTIC